MILNERATRQRDRGRGMNLVEVVVSIGIVGVMFAASVTTVGASKTMQKKIGDRGRGALLARQLMSEILEQDYADAAYGPDSFGLGADEAATGDRSLFDDVDDYHNWSASPPQQKDGTVMTDLSGWRRSVAVVWVKPSNLSQTVGTNKGVKRITVTVTRNDQVTASMVAVRAYAADTVAGMRQRSSGN